MRNVKRLTLIVVAVFSLVPVACPRTRPRYEPLRPEQTAIGIVRDEATGRLTVHPYRAPAFRGKTAEWFSTLGRINAIEWQTPRNLDDIEQPKLAKAPEVSCNDAKDHCWVQIPAAIEYGRYKYHLRLTTPDNQEVIINQPELDIRG